MNVLLTSPVLGTNTFPEWIDGGGRHSAGFGKVHVVTPTGNGRAVRLAIGRDEGQAPAISTSPTRLVPMDTVKTVVVVPTMPQLAPVPYLNPPGNVCRPAGPAGGRRTRATQQKAFQCPSCWRSYDTEQRLFEHRKVHSAPKLYACTYCDYTCRQKGNMRGHERTHTGERPYQCEVCSDYFRFPTELATHLERHRDGVKRCSICQATFLNNRSLRRHLLRVHQQSTPNCRVRCGNCRLWFAGSAELDIHTCKPGEAFHELKCQLCAQSFASFDQLQKHGCQHRQATSTSRATATPPYTGPPAIIHPAPIHFLPAPSTQRFSLMPAVVLSPGQSYALSQRSMDALPESPPTSRAQSVDTGHHASAPSPSHIALAMGGPAAPGHYVGSVASGIHYSGYVFPETKPNAHRPNYMEYMDLSQKEEEMVVDELSDDDEMPPLIRMA